MNSLLMLTQSANSILRPIALALGWLMSKIYDLFARLGVLNIALTIIVFTIIIYVIMLPLTYQQQKFSKLSQIMNPEIQAIQKKYRGKKDSASMQAQNEETQEIYRKYGVRPSGSCVFLVIQFLILIPLYRVIYSVPGYVTQVKDTFTDLVNQIMAVDGYQATMTSFLERISENNTVLRQVSLTFTEGRETSFNSIIDVLYRCTDKDWSSLTQIFPGLTDLINSTHATVAQFTNFLGASIVYSPINLIRTSWQEGQFLLILIGILIPVISAGSQFLSVRLMPQANTGAADQTGQSMRMMNYFMPIYSFFIVFFLPIGVGIYWIAGAVIRIIQQFFINRHFDRIDMNAVVEKNAAKAEAKEKKKIEKKGVTSEQMRAAAQINTKQVSRSMADKAAAVARANAEEAKASGKGSSTSAKSSGSNRSSSKKGKKSSTPVKKPDVADESAATASKGSGVKYKEGSLASFANKVTEYNEKNSK